MLIILFNFKCNTRRLWLSRKKGGCWTLAIRKDRSTTASMLMMSVSLGLSYRRRPESKSKPRSASTKPATSKPSPQGPKMPQKVAKQRPALRESSPVALAKTNAHPMRIPSRVDSGSKQTLFSYTSLNWVPPACTGQPQRSEIYP